MNLENTAMLCQTNLENADPDRPQSDGTCLVVLRVNVADLPDMVVITSISEAEYVDLTNRLDAQILRTRRLARMGLS